MEPPMTAVLQPDDRRGRTMEAFALPLVALADA
jgi:hypothetical protein